MSPADLRLRPPRASDETAVRAAQQEIESPYVFAIFLDDLAFPEWLDLLHRMRDGDERMVPGVFLLAEVDGEVVGRTSVRFALNEILTARGGHVGYSVRPAFRRRGYATEILRQSLVVARAGGVERVLVTCDDDNVGSATVIERNGGVLDPDRPRDSDKRRYWID